MTRFSSTSKYAGFIKLWSFLVVTVAFVTVTMAAELQVAHDIQIDLMPKSMKLIGTDTITVKSAGDKRLNFRLSKHVSILNLDINGKPGNYEFRDGRLQLRLGNGAPMQDARVTIRYVGIFDDPFPVRPVNTDNPGYGVSGTISETGSFLLAGAGWYPHLENSHSTYKLKVSAPAGMVAVTAGRAVSRLTQNGKTESEWEIDYPVEGLSLSVARYIVEEKRVGDVTAATYFLESNKHLAESYLEATARYIKLYSELFGPYPFQKFAIVENFFPTGYGFPSYTLLGSTVLRLPFIVHTSLGHEIAHCWWGNGVLVDYSSGNWSEGLTTYVADYLFKQMKSENAARDYRRQWLRNFSTLVRPENDFALRQFYSRHSPPTKAVGYDKSAMVFHMLRKVVGEEVFWEALKDLYRNHLFRKTSWVDIQNAFEAKSNRSLQTFFDQWIYRKGAPQFYIDSVQTKRTNGAWKIRGEIVQNDPYFEFPLMMKIDSGEQEHLQKIEVTGNATSFELVSKDSPRRLTADPDFDVMRWLYPSEIPPAINSLKSSKSLLIVIADNTDSKLQEAAEILLRSLGTKNYAFAENAHLNDKRFLESDLLLIGHPQRTEMLQKLPGPVTIRSDSFSLNSTLYRQPSNVFFGVFHHPFNPNRVAALFMPLSSEYAESVARKITHYGKYSYLAFENGKNHDKGFWPVEKSPLVHKFENN
jgi:hypothetical protein